MNVSERILRPIVLPVAQLPAAQSRLRMLCLLPAKNQSTCPFESVPALVQRRQHGSAVHQRRRDVGKGQIGPLRREGHFDVRGERMVPLRLSRSFGIGVPVVIEAAPVEDMRGPDSPHQLTRGFGIHLPHKTIIRLMTLHLVGAGILSDGPFRLQIPGQMTAPIQEPVSGLKMLERITGSLCGGPAILGIIRQRAQTIEKANQGLLAREV